MYRFLLSLEVHGRFASQCCAYIKIYTCTMHQEIPTKFHHTNTMRQEMLSNSFIQTKCKDGAPTSWIKSLRLCPFDTLYKRLVNTTGPYEGQIRSRLGPDPLQSLDLLLTWFSPHLQLECHVRRGLSRSSDSRAGEVVPFAPVKTAPIEGWDMLNLVKWAAILHQKKRHNLVPLCFGHTLCCIVFTFPLSQQHPSVGTQGVGGLFFFFHNSFISFSSAWRFRKGMEEEGGIKHTGLCFFGANCWKLLHHN